MSSPGRRRRAAAAVGLVASLAGLPLLLVAAAGPPALGGLPTWGWVAGGLRDQYLPVEPLLAAIGVLAWGLWAYAMLVTVLRLVAVVAVRRGVGGSAGLLAFSNLVTVAPLRSLVDAAVGVSLLASASHAVAAPGILADPRRWCGLWMRRPAGTAPPSCWVLSSPTSTSLSPVWPLDRSSGLGRRRPIPTARPTPVLAGCIRCRRAIRCGGSPTASWVMATAGGRSLPSTRDAG
jgi:hypothetical protein